MRLFLLNRYFHPDESATSRMASSLAFGLAERGWDVHAVTSRQLLQDPLALLPCQQSVDGVSIHRIWTTYFGRSNIVGRAIDYLTYYLSVITWLLRHARRGDVIIVATDPPLLSIFVSLASALTGAAQVNWLQDLYPEVADALGVPMPNAGYRFIQKLRDYSLVRAAMNVAIGDRMSDYVRSRRVPRTRLAIVHNWSDGASIRPLEASSNPLRAEWGLAEKFVVGYSGNLGRGHEFETILGAAKALQKDDGIAFLFIGAGHHLTLVEDRVAAFGLKNVTTRPYQPPSQLTESLGVADLHLVSLKPALEGLMVPCKFFGIAAAGRPVVYIGDARGEIPSILKAADCGCVVSIGDVSTLVASIKQLQLSPVDAARWGNNARDVFMRRFDRHHALGQWCAVLNGVVARSVKGETNSPQSASA